MEIRLKEHWPKHIKAQIVNPLITLVEQPKTTSATAAGLFIGPTPLVNALQLSDIDHDQHALHRVIYIAKHDLDIPTRGTSAIVVTNRNHQLIDSDPRLYRNCLTEAIDVGIRHFYFYGPIRTLIYHSDEINAYLNKK